MFFQELGLGPAAFKGKTVLLKPNLVEPTRTDPQINTHPAVIRAAGEVFRRWQAREVIVAEGQGHCRDSQYVLDQSGLAPVLAESRLEFIDLNHDDDASGKSVAGSHPPNISNVADFSSPRKSPLRWFHRYG